MTAKRRQPLLLTCVLLAAQGGCLSRTKDSCPTPSRPPGARPKRAAAVKRPVIDPKIEAKVTALLAKMTLEEKVGQLTQLGELKPDHEALIRAGKVGSLLNVHGARRTNALQKIAVEGSRLGIPLLLANDVIHGYRTIFPIPLAEAASWDASWVERSARVAAKEAAAAGTHWTFAPMVDVARDPRWGRVAEGSGEDPYLGSVMAAARVRGFQGDDLASPDTVLACAKHFVGYGAPEAGRDYNTVDLSLRTLREVHFPPFLAAITAGAGTVMCAFNEINGVPASANRFTLTEVLRDEWGFGGIVVSDWESIAELRSHGIAATKAEAAEKAFTAGVDMEMQSGVYLQHLAGLVRGGKLDSRLVDASVRRVLRAKLKLGLFERPYVDPSREQATLLSREHRRVALEMARRSIVLLKNDRRVLPLSKKLKALAVIGPLAASKTEPLGSWAAKGRPEEVVSVVEGISKKVSPATKLLVAKGCDLEGGSTPGIAAAARIASQAEVVVVVVGERADMSGEAASRAALGLPGHQLALVQALQATGTPVVVVLMNGRPLTLPWIAGHVPAILESWFLGTQAGAAVADVLFGDVNPGGKLPITFPRAVGQVPIYYSHKPTGRPPSDKKYSSKYLDVAVQPLFPFGFGLSYTTFRLDNLRLSSQVIRPDEVLTVSVDLKNVGDRSGDEVVQLYLRDRHASVTRPVKQLRGFARVSLAAGEQKTLTFSVGKQDLGLWDRDLRFVVEPGAFQLWVGTSSTQGLTSHFQVAAARGR